MKKLSFLTFIFSSLSSFSFAAAAPQLDEFNQRLLKKISSVYCRSKECALQDARQLTNLDVSKFTDSFNHLTLVKNNPKVTDQEINEYLQPISQALSHFYEYVSRRCDGSYRPWPYEKEAPFDLLKGQYEKAIAIVDKGFDQYPAYKASMCKNPGLCLSVSLKLSAEEDCHAQDGIGH